MYAIDLSKISFFSSRAEKFPVCSTLTLPWQLGEYAYLFDTGLCCHPSKMPSKPNWQKSELASKLNNTTCNTFRRKA